MAEKYEIKIGVKDLLEVQFLPKDINPSFFSPDRGQEGTYGHQLVAAERPSEYQTEVTVEAVYENDLYCLTVRGRVDGLLKENSSLIVEEIKTTYIPLASLSPGQFPVHEAQLKLYTHFIQEKYPDLKVTGKLTYLNLDDLTERSFLLEQSAEEGKVFFRELAEAYLEMESSCHRWRCERNLSINRLPFPFAEPRPGQQELMDSVTQALEQERDIFIEAATGSGKTIAVLFPALKRLAVSNRFNQIFFLTAKNAGKEILKKTLLQLMDQGLRLRTVFIEAKERSCLIPGTDCHPRDCLYAADYYQKVRPIIPQLLAEEYISPELVKEAARSHIVCPFELSLDLSLFADLIVCDYNYVFDPGVYLRRFFAKNNRKDFLFLIDEAHNLVTRGRDMYSATLSVAMLRRFQTEMEKQLPVAGMVCESLITFFNNWQRELTEEQTPGILIRHLPEFFIPTLEKLAACLELELKESTRPHLRERVLEFYFEISAFTRIANLVNEDYAIYVKPAPERKKDLMLQLFCLNPGAFLRERLNHGRLAVFFSATLTPFDYYQDLLGSKNDALNFRLTSPFPKETRLYFHIPNIDTRYRLRDHSAQKLAQCITTMINSHQGNYLIFFPSYAYLQNIVPLVKMKLTDDTNLFIQYPSMKEKERLEFINKVTETGKNRSNVGFAVLGGSFGEGIDLPGEKLVGVMIIGPGLPMVCEEQELIKGYFDERNGHGFLYAYLIPGLTRVIQAAGRVFRTPEDKGVVVLVDDRFLHEHYQELLPPDWFVPGRPFSAPEFEEILADFWKEVDENE